MRLVVVSPHLDDAVFSCGSLIAAVALVTQVLVVTVCAGAPEGVEAAPLDRAAGFGTAMEAILARRREDEEACGRLGADVVHLDVFDQQYAPEKTADEIRAALLPVTATAGTFLVPVGIRHVDHVLVARALRGRADLAYAELPYRALWPEQVPTGLGDPVLEVPATPQKMEAVGCYRSQIGDGEPGESLAVLERYYRVRGGR